MGVIGIADTVKPGAGGHRELKSRGLTVVMMTGDTGCEPSHNRSVSST